MCSYQVQDRRLSCRRCRCRRHQRRCRRRRHHRRRRRRRRRRRLLHQEEIQRNLFRTWNESQH